MVPIQCLQDQWMLSIWRNSLYKHSDLLEYSLGTVLRLNSLVTYRIATLRWFTEKYNTARLFHVRATSSISRYLQGDVLLAQT